MNTRDVLQGLAKFQVFLYCHRNCQVATGIAKDKKNILDIILYWFKTGAQTYPLDFLSNPNILRVSNNYNL